MPSRQTSMNEEVFRSLVFLRVNQNLILEIILKLFLNLNVFIRCSKCKHRVKSLPSLFYAWLDRVYRVDHEYHLLNLFWSSFAWETLDIRKTSEKVNFWPMWRKHKFSPVYIELNSSQLFYSDSASKSEYIHIS